MSAYGVSSQGIRAAAFGVTIPDGLDVDEKLDRLITKAEMLLPAACIARRITAGELSADVVGSVVEDMVIRVAKNAAGYRQRTIDDYSVTIDTALSSGALYLSDDERDRLCPSSPGRGRVGSVAIGIPVYRLPGSSRV